MSSLKRALPMILLTLGAHRLEAQKPTIQTTAVKVCAEERWFLGCIRPQLVVTQVVTHPIDSTVIQTAHDRGYFEARNEMMSKSNTPGSSLQSAAPPDATEVNTTSSVTPPKHAPTRHAFTCGPVSQEGLASAVVSGKDGDRKVLCHIKASTYVSAMNETYNLRLENREDFAQWIREAHVVRCPAGPTRLLRTKNDGTVDFKGWVRNLHPDEMCLENNGNFISLWCGNPAPDLRVAEAPQPSQRLLGTPVPLSVVRQPEVPRVYTAPPPVIIQEKKKGNILKPIGFGLAAAVLFCVVSHTITWDGPCGKDSPPPVNLDVENHILIQTKLYSGGLIFSHPLQ